jgi:predicted nucleotidyltransferase
MTEGSTLARLLEVAVGQHGFITPDTAAAAGVDPARLPVMLARGQLERWGRGLYRIPQLPIGKYDVLAAAVMRVGHGAVVSHASALYLHGLTDASPERIDVTIPTSARVRRAGLDGITVWREDLVPADLATVDGIPTTTLDRATRNCDEAELGPAAATSPRATALSRDNGPVERPRVELIDGKVLYDGRSLVAWASRVADRIVERCDASRIVLYGSVARGDDGPDSDIDLLVVMPIVGRRHDTSVRVLNELRDLPVPVDITIVDPAHLDEEASVPGIVRAAMREGRVLVAA